MYVRQVRVRADASGNRCKAPYAGNGPPPQGRFNCIASATTITSARHWLNMDGRAFNLLPRIPETGAIVYPSSVFGWADPRWGGGGWYRIHQTKKMANADPAATNCRSSDASEQIGCLVSADPCSIGYGGLNAVAAPLNKALLLRTPGTEALAEVGPTQSNVLELLGTCPGVGMRYPLARALYINAAKGLANLTNGPTAGNVTGEKDLYQCLSDRANHITDSAILDSKLIAIPGTDAYPTRTCQP